MTVAAEDDVLVNAGETIGSTLGKIVATANHAVTAMNVENKKAKRVAKRVAKKAKKQVARAKKGASKAAKRGKKLLKKVKKRARR